MKTYVFLLTTLLPALIFAQEQEINMVFFAESTTRTVAVNPAFFDLTKYENEAAISLIISTANTHIARLDYTVLGSNKTYNATDCKTKNSIEFAISFFNIYILSDSKKKFGSLALLFLDENRKLLYQKNIQIKFYK